MKAMIFCAGLGTRLKPLTDTMPKALVPLAGKPLLQWQVERLRDAGITDIIVNVHHFPDMIIDTIRRNNGWGCNILISDERDQLLDTGGGLRKAKSEIINQKSEMASEPILACNVDILSNINLRAFIAAYENQKSKITNQKSPLGLLVVSERQTQRYLCFDEQGSLCGWTNIATGEVKPSTLKESCLAGAKNSQLSTLQKLAFSGMQILNPDIFCYLDQVAAEKGDKFSLIDLYLHIVQLQTTNQRPMTKETLNGPILKAYVPDAYKMMDVGKIDQIAEAERFAESL